jgi:oxygen-independent coproporphyrinogen-3 oxidase
MAGLYLHIPFCRKLCSYCDFFKTTVLSRIPDYLLSVEKEMIDRNSYLDGEALETIYLGGGTPSVFEAVQLKDIFSKVKQCFEVLPECEITLEANPDDLTREYLRFLYQSTPVNRLSIGIQSFNDNDLKMLNRRHTSEQAIQSIIEAREAGYRNIGIDLMYGLPGMTKLDWKKNLDLAFSLGVQHISAYHLTVEPHTALSRTLIRGLLQLPEEDESAGQFFMLNSMAGENDFIHYEISNLAKSGFISKHNANYWQRKKYLGLGPSAHSYNLVSRQWNVSNVAIYTDALVNGKSYYVSEELDKRIRYNEYIMLSLRTCWGVRISEILQEHGKSMATVFENRIKPLLQTDWMVRQGDSVFLTPRGWLVSDYIVSRLLF